jgi:RNA polymerase sigma factor (TIGR02999 family)
MRGNLVRPSGIGHPACHDAGRNTDSEATSDGCDQSRATICSAGMSEVTRLLDAAAAGEPHAAAELLPLVYDELRRLAAARMADEKPGQTLQATALVHEAYLRLIGDQPHDWNGRGHFFAAAAEAMRRILVDHARWKKSQKRGGGRVRAEFREDVLAAPEGSDEILAVDEALAGLAAADSQAAELVKLRYFAGLSVDETAQALKISPRSVDRLWTYARAWLHRAIGEA